MSRLTSEKELTIVQTMAHRQLQPSRLLRLAVVLLLFLLVQSAFAIPFLQARANLNPRMFYRNAGSLVSVVVSGSRQIVGSFETLYELRQFVIATSQTAASSSAASANSASGSSTPAVLCDYRPTPARSGTPYHCPTSGRSSNRFTPAHCS
jgi:hypothetical protein